MNLQGVVERHSNTSKLEIKTTNNMGLNNPVPKCSLAILNAKGLPEAMRMMWAKGLRLQLTLNNTGLNCMNPFRCGFFKN